VPDIQQPLVGVIDEGFGAGEHGSEVLQTIAARNPQSPAWLGGGVGKGTWAKSLNDFVNTAKSLGQRAVTNLSFDLTEKGSDGSITTRSQLTTDEQQALSYAQENGVLIVASSGNQGGTMSALGQASQQFDNIITVGAAEGNDRASYSSFGTGLDLVAPGREAGDRFVGTSRSAATVTGTISEMWAANPNLDYRQVSRVLESTATDLKTPGWDAETGAGLLNSRAAVNLATNITPETQQFSGAQLMQQVDSSFNHVNWSSSNGAIASERTNREIEGESIQEDERIRAAYRRAQTQAKQKPAVQTTAPKPSVRKERPLNRFEQAEAANIRREQRVAAERQRLAKEKAALTQVARNPGISLADRSEARKILRQREAAAKAPIQPKEPAKPPAPKKKGLFDRFIADPIKKAGDELEQAANAAKDTATDVGDWAKRNKGIISEVGHTALDVAGMVPVVGAVADGVNAGWYLAEGDYTNAALSAAGMVPGVGDAATAAKLAAKGAKYAKNADKVAGAVQKGTNAGERAYEAYGAVQEAQGVVEGVGDAYSEFAKGNYGNAALALGQAGLSAAGARDGVKAADGRGRTPKRSSEGDRPLSVSNKSGGTQPAPHGKRTPTSPKAATATGTGEKRNPLEPRVLTRRSGSRPSPNRRSGSLISIGGRNDESTRPAIGRPSGRRDSTRPSTLLDKADQDRPKVRVGQGLQENKGIGFGNHKQSGVIGGDPQSSPFAETGKPAEPDVKGQQPNPSGIATSPNATAKANQNSGTSATGGSGSSNQSSLQPSNAVPSHTSSTAHTSAGGSSSAYSGGNPPQFTPAGSGSPLSSGQPAPKSLKQSHPQYSRVYKGQIRNAEQSALRALDRLPGVPKNKGTDAVTETGKITRQGRSGGKRNKNLANAVEAMMFEYDIENVEGRPVDSHAERKVFIEEYHSGSSKPIIAIAVNRLLCDPAGNGATGCVDFFTDVANRTGQTVLIVERDADNPSKTYTRIFRPGDREPKRRSAKKMK